MEILEIKPQVMKIHENIEKVIVGKSDNIDLILTALLANGHVLLEDVPGTGKTMLAKALAKSIDMDFARIQFTPDLLPSDVTGLYYFNQKESEFTLRKGAVFTNILLADEINRATPRTQSSLLECMEEKQVTIDNHTMQLASPFFVIATQNPVETAGTFPLPEAQMDRFMMQLSMGFPSLADEMTILSRFITNSPIDSLDSVLNRDTLITMQQAVKNVFVHKQVMEYLLTIVSKTRNHSDIALGVSTRGSLAFVKACQAYAAVTGLTYVTPEIVKHIAPYVLCHRLILQSSFDKAAKSKEILDQIISDTLVPTEDFTK